MQKRVFSRPVVVVSRCLGFDPVRYNGDMISSPEVEMMRPFVTFIPVCPEVEIGLGIPRASVRIVRDAGGDHLVQPSTGEDVTDAMLTFCSAFLDGIGTVDGFILKNRSPTSGISGVNIYPSREKSAPVAKEAGFFGRMVLDRYAGYPVEDEGRIRNYRIRDHFLTRIFMLADLDRVVAAPSVPALTRFHAGHKLILMAYSQGVLKRLGGIAANREGLPVSELISLYSRTLIQGTERPARYTSHVNVLLHAFGYFSDELSPGEKEFFLRMVEEYRRGLLPVVALRKVMQGWILRFGTPYLGNQAYFAPYPDELVRLDDALIDRGREMYE